MSRYFSRAKKAIGAVRPRADWLDDEPPLLPSIEVDDHQAIETGLVDLSGSPIMRAPNPMGFGRNEEW